MAEVKIPKGIKPKEFFMKFLPETFETSVAGMDLSEYSGIDWRGEYTITGPDGGVFGVVIKDAKELTVTEGKLDDAWLNLEVSDQVFSGALDGKYPEIPMDKLEEGLANPQNLITSLPPEEVKEKLEAFQSISGRMELSLTSGSETIDLAMIYNGEESPKCKMMGALSDIIGIMTKELNPVQAFMSGKFKIEGDMAFALKLQTLM